MNKIIVTYDKSNEDIATLVVCIEEERGLLVPSTMRINKIITGKKAEDIWEELTDMKARKKAAEEALKRFDSICESKSEPCTAGTEK